MSYPLTGNYKILNANFTASNTMVDLRYGDSTYGTPVFGWANFRNTVSVSNDLVWTLQVVDSTSNGKLVRLINVQSGTFANAPIFREVQPIVGGADVQGWLLCATNTPGQYSIQSRAQDGLPDGFFAWTLENDDMTPVILSSTDTNNPKQAWIFCPVN